MAKYDLRYDENDNPLIEDCQKYPFAVFYSSPEVTSAFDNLYSNKKGLFDKFVAYWDVVAKAF